MTRLPWKPRDRLGPAPVICVLVTLGAAAFGAAVPTALGGRVLAEGGVVETASVILHLCAALSAAWFWRRGLSPAATIGLLSLLMAARELDAHRAFTTYGVFSTRFYVKSEVPLVEKLSAVGFLIVAGFLLAAALWGSRRMLAEVVRRGGPSISTAVTTAAFAILLKEIDGAPRMLARAGIDLTDRVDLALRAMEEIGEMALPTLSVLLLIQMADTLKPRLPRETRLARMTPSPGRVPDPVGGRRRRGGRSRRGISRSRGRAG